MSWRILPPKYSKVEVQSCSRKQSICSSNLNLNTVLKYMYVVTDQQYFSSLEWSTLEVYKLDLCRTSCKSYVLWLYIRDYVILFLQHTQRVIFQKLKFFPVFQSSTRLSITRAPCCCCCSQNADIQRNSPCCAVTGRYQGFGSSTKSSRKMDLLSPVNPILLARQKAGPYSGLTGRETEWICCQYVGKQPDCSAETQWVSGIQLFATTIKNDCTGECTRFRPLTTICIYFALLQTTLRAYVWVSDWFPTFHCIGFCS